MFYFLKSVGRFKRKYFYNVSRICFNNFSSSNSISRVTPPWRIVFYGTDIISKVTLKALNENRLSSLSDSRVVESLAVVCVQSVSLVRKYCTENNLTVYTWPYEVPSNTYDVGIVVSFGHMIPSSSIHACKYGIINAHPSLLPRWRGAAPIFYTILKGDEETGVTITQVSPCKFDAGNILMQKHYTMPEQCTSKLLMKDLAIIAAEMVLKTLEKLPHYIENSYPQSTEGRTLARKIKSEQCCIDWKEDSVIQIDRKFRAFNGFFDIYTIWRDSVKLTILDMASPEEVKEAQVPDLVKEPVNTGFCYFHKKRKVIFVKCKDGWSGIKSLRIPKRGKITALDFYNGFMTKVKPQDCYFT